jgi:hypothetical protein
MASRFAAATRRPPLFGLAAAFWLFAAIPSALVEQRYPVEAYLSALVFSLLAGCILRGLYVRAQARRDNQRRFVSPWLFLVAGLVALISAAVSWGGQSTGSIDRKAVAYGVAPAGHIRPQDRCATRAIDKMRAEYRQNQDLVDTFARQFCADASLRQLVAHNGTVADTPQTKILYCADWEVEVNRARAAAGGKALPDAVAVKAAPILCNLVEEGKLDQQRAQGQRERQQILERLLAQYEKQH